MARSVKKGPFCDAHLMKKVEALNASGKKEIIKTWSRRSVIYPSFIEHTFAVYNGHEHITVYAKKILQIINAGYNSLITVSGSFHQICAEVQRTSVMS